MWAWRGARLPSSCTLDGWCGRRLDARLQRRLPLARRGDIVVVWRREHRWRNTIVMHLGDNEDRADEYSCSDKNNREQSPLTFAHASQTRDVRRAWHPRPDIVWCAICAANGSGDGQGFPVEAVSKLLGEPELVGSGQNGPIQSPSRPEHGTSSPINGGRLREPQLQPRGPRPGSYVSPAGSA